MIDGLGTLHEVEDGYLLRFERVYSHPPARVWQLITEPEGLARWFPARVRYARLAVGESMSFRFGAEDLERAAEQGVEDVPEESGGAILEVEPERVFCFDWLGQTLRFELSPEASGCRLVFTHRFPRDHEEACRTGAGWHFCLEHLEAALAGREGPAPEPRSTQLRAAYAEALT